MRVSKAFIAIDLFMAAAYGQTDYIVVPASSPEWSADTMWIGASFAQTALGPVVVRLKANYAGASGTLAIVHPVTGTTRNLFTNFSAIGTAANIDAEVHSVPLNTPITFRYVTNWPWNSDRKYSGPNLPGLSPHVSDSSTDAFPDPNRRYGHRWCLVGKEKAGGVLTGNLEFGFEDNSSMGPPMGPTDMDFNDIIFTVSGLRIGKETRTLASKGFVW